MFSAASGRFSALLAVFPPKFTVPLALTVAAAESDPLAFRVAPLATVIVLLAVSAPVDATVHVPLLTVVLPLELLLPLMMTPAPLLVTKTPLAPAMAVAFGNVSK